jgi:hypothetical protein
MIRPAFLKIGQLVMTDGWPGEIMDVAETDTGAIMVLINSPKAIWRNHRPEWLQYIEGRIVPCGLSDTTKLFDAYVEYVEIMQQELRGMWARWEKNETN